MLLLEDPQRKLKPFRPCDIADALGLSRGRISQEMKVIREHHQERTSDEQRSLFIGWTVAVYDEIERCAWLLLDSCTDGRMKLKILKVIGSIIGDRIRFLMDVGLLKAAPTVSPPRGNPAVSALLATMIARNRAAVIADATSLHGVA